LIEKRKSREKGKRKTNKKQNKEGPILKEKNGLRTRCI
jgi:hypothetical protein